MTCPSCDVAERRGWSITFDFNCQDCAARLYRTTFPLARPGVMYQIARFQPPEICDEIAAAKFGGVVA